MNHNQNRMKPGIVHSSIRMLIPMNRQSEALEILGAVSAQVRFEPSCIFSRLYRGVDDARAIMIEERWANGESIRHHLQSDAYRRVLMVVEMAEEPPEIRFDTILESNGVEIIENARLNICDHH